MFYILHIPADHKQPVKETPQRTVPDNSQLNLLVGGYLKAVPYWDRDSYGRRCVAFCNEEGKLEGLPVNDRAMSGWIRAAGVLNDVLCGDIVVISTDTDEEFSQL